MQRNDVGERTVRQRGIRSGWVVRLMMLPIALGTASASPAAGQRDNFMCYKVKQSRDQPAYGKTLATKKLYASLDDRLDPNNAQGMDPNSVTGVRTNVQVKKVKEICAPAGVDGDNIADPNGVDGTHYVMYQVKPQKGQCAGDLGVPCKDADDCTEAGTTGPCDPIAKFDKRADRNRSIRAVDRFSDIQVDLAKEVMVLLPASKDAIAFQGAPVDEHYKCYSVKPTKSFCVVDSPAHAREACKKEIDCGGTEDVTAYCQRALKFPKQTHPDGLEASVHDQFTELFDGADSEKPFALRKLKMFCQATDKKLADPASNEARLEQQASLLCYSVKAGKAACDGGDNDNQTCKKDVDCPGGTCRDEPKFDKKSANVQGMYVEDQLFQHRLDVAKEDLLCNPACRVKDFELTQFAAHVSTLSLVAVVDVGVNVDGLSTCAPGGCDPGLGIDNQLAGIAGIVNPLLQDELDAGSINLLFQAGTFENSASFESVISGFTADLATPTGCAAGSGDPNDPVDPGDPNDPCNYLVNGSNIQVETRTSCQEKALISLPLTITGADTVPSAAADGGGPGANFTLSLPFGETPIEITAQSVRVDADITHDGADLVTIGGVLGGGVNHAALVDAVRAQQDSCDGGANDGQDCDPNQPDPCPGGGSCQLLGGFQSGQLADFIRAAFPPDLDLGAGGSCRGGSNQNEACADDLADCPDSVSGGVSCDPRESVSLNLEFGAENTSIVGKN